MLVSVSASGLALSSLLLSRLDRFSALASAFLSFFVVAYALSYGRASTIFAVIVSISLSALTVLWPLTYSIRVSTKLLRLLIYIAITALVFSIAFPFVATFIDFAYTRFVMRAFDQGGSDRLDIWNHFFDSFAGADPLSILFGSNLSGAHNLFLDLLVRVGVLGLALFIFSLFTGLRIFFMSARDSGIAIFPPSVPLILFFSIAVVGNIFNVSLTQPWPIASYLFFWAASSVCSLAAHKARRGVAMSNIAPL